ncbi:MAG: imidazoleglycerol-phosphate dehydratase, partial [Clostridia bacterium]|nr:imidazoleglycerol-phosphate dehydratase [Clostridia bacterium]
MNDSGRIAEIERNTAETQVQIRLGLDGGRVCVDSGVGFLNHMLTLFAAHGQFGLEVRCT